MNRQKIIFAGPTGAGKTTAVESVSDQRSIHTDERSSDMAKKQKKRTTVALDFGVTEFNNNEKIHIYGVPGQERFSFMWDILAQGGDGLVLLADNSRPNPISDLRFYLKAFKRYIAETKLVIGITRSDVKRGPSLEAYRRELHTVGLAPTILYVDARRKSDVTQLVKALLSSMSPLLSERVSTAQNQRPRLLQVAG